MKTLIAISLLRKATLKDTDFVLEVRNESSARKASINTGLIRKKDHLRWFPKHFQEYEIITNYGTQIGYLRKDENGYISIALIPKARNKGIGQAVLRETYGKAIVLINNEASLNAFLKGNYTVRGLYLEKKE